MNSRIVFDLSFELVSMFDHGCLQEGLTFPFYSQTLLPLLLPLQWHNDAIYGGFLSGMTVN